MGTFDDFHTGQRVAHISLGDGTVTRKSLAIVEVEFDNKTTVGKYDRRWFEIYPTYLFHRTRMVSS